LLNPGDKWFSRRQVDGWGSRCRPHSCRSTDQWSAPAERSRLNV